MAIDRKTAHDAYSHYMREAFKIPEHPTNQLATVLVEQGIPIANKLFDSLFDMFQAGIAFSEVVNKVNAIVPTVSETPDKRHLH